MVSERFVLELVLRLHRRFEGIGSCDEVNKIVRGLSRGFAGRSTFRVTICREASKAQKPHVGGFGVWQDGLHFDPPLEFFVQTFDASRRADRSGLARGKAHGAETARVPLIFFTHRE
jgi:hypothetical protein